MQETRTLNHKSRCRGSKKHRLAEAINTVTTSVVGGAEAFLGRICLPAAEEFGLLLRDRVHATG